MQGFIQMYGNKALDYRNKFEYMFSVGLTVVNGDWLVMILHVLELNCLIRTALTLARQR